MRKTVSILIMLTVFVPPSVRAESFPIAKAINPIGDSTTEREVETVRRAVEIKTGNDATTVSMKLGGTLSGREKNERARFNAWALTATAPTSTNDRSTALATLDGLADSFTLEWKMSQLRVSLRNPAMRPSDLAHSDRICAAAREVYIGKRKAAAGSDVDPDKLLEQIQRDWLCDMAHVKQYLPERYQEFRSLYWDPNARKSIWGAAVKGGYKKFEYLDPTNGGKADSDETSWSFKAYYGWLLTSPAALVAIGMEYQDAVKDATEATLCQPPDTNGVQTCNTGALGAPVNNDKTLAFVEWRSRISITKKQQARVSVRLTHDFKQDQFGVDVPIYLWTDKDSNFTGGIRLGWKSDPSDFDIGIIVGASFTITGGL